MQQQKVPTKVAINGLGTIGRETLKILMMRKGIEIVGVNDVIPIWQLAYGLKYDSVYGPYRKNVKVDKDHLVVKGQRIRVFNEAKLADIDWQSVGAEIVIDSTGKFLTLQRDIDRIGGKGEGVDKHNAEKVILSAPAKDSPDIPTYVRGVNFDKVNGNEKVISNGSCTTNCVGPLIRIILENYSILWGSLLTVHAYTLDQKLLDTPHKDSRRGRSAALSIVPTSTGAHKAIIALYPELKGKLSGYCYRVPTPDGSLVDLTVELDKKTDVNTINKLFKSASKNELKGILGYTDDPIVSSDIIGNPLSSLVDGLLTTVMQEGRKLRVVSWYDNVLGYAHRVADLTEIVASRKG